MQPLKSRFLKNDASHYSSLQSCIRTDDLELVGDGSHLTSFDMLGCFSFGGDDYGECCLMWKQIIQELGIRVTHITAHPTQDNHKRIWTDLGFTIVDSGDCEWSDGNIGGFCCEMFVNDLEIGNLVNPMGHSVDVGFGLERMIQVIEKQDRVDTTSIFDTQLNPVARDHIRTLRLMKENGIYPGSKGQYSICRKLVRRLLNYGFVEEFKDWMLKESLLLDRMQSKLVQYKNIFHTKPWHYWKETHGLNQEEIETFLKQESDVD